MTHFPILNAAERVLVPVLLVYSVALLATGHEQPGGGFSGGLVAASAFALRAIVRDPAREEHDPSMWPRLVLATGLLLVWIAAILPVFLGKAPLTAMSVGLHLPPGLTIGTEFLFETGVYLVSAGAALTVLRAILRKP